ncbi:MAG: hypothetical protein NXI10_09205 [bacterium]|nr:hypothetical protein [bacterium]
MKTAMIALLALLPLMGVAQDCEQFKTGTYRIKGESGEIEPNYSIVRTKKFQIERIGENYVKTKVKWIDDCTYKLTFVKSDIMDIPKGTVTICTIKDTFEGGYHGVGSSPGIAEEVPFTMYRVDGGE